MTALRAKRGKAACDSARNDAFDDVAVQVAKNVSQCMPCPGESRDEVADVFAALQARTIRLMSGGAAEMAVLEDSPPRCVESDVCAAKCPFRDHLPHGSEPVCHHRALLSGSFGDYSGQ